MADVATNPPVAKLREDLARALTELASDTLSGRLPLWQVNRLARVVGDERDLIVRIDKERLRLEEPYAVRTAGNEWKAVFPCGCQRLQDDTGKLLARGRCEPHRCLKNAPDVDEVPPPPRGALLPLLRRVK